MSRIVRTQQVLYKFKYEPVRPAGSSELEATQSIWKIPFW